MPVRIYDISKKLGLENKEVLSKAKALGIAAARVASSSLDKITAEYLEQQLILEHPQRAAPPPPAPAVAAAQETATQTTEKQETITETATALLEPEPEPLTPASAEDQAGVATSPVELPESAEQPEPVAKAPLP